MSALKPILVIDNRKLYAPAGAHADLVREVPSAKREDLDPSEWGAVFVHAANADELNWAREHAREHFGGVYFKVTGEKGEADVVTELYGAYKLPRWAFKDHFEAFLAAYRAKGFVDRDVANVFFGK